MAKGNIFSFFQEARTEIAKVTWPSRRETVITSMMVFVMVVFAAIFFFLVDLGLHYGVGALLG